MNGSAFGLTVQLVPGPFGSNGVELGGRENQRVSAINLFLLRQYDPHALEFVAGYAAVAAAAGFADPRYFRDHVVNSAHASTHIGHDILSVHCPYGHFYILNGEIATHPSSGQVLGDRRREAVTLRRQQDTTGWQQSRVSCPVSSGSVVSR